MIIARLTETVAYSKGFDREDVIEWLSSVETFEKLDAMTDDELARLLGDKVNDEDFDATEIRFAVYQDGDTVSETWSVEHVDI